MWSHTESIGNGVCSISEESIGEVPVLNKSDEPPVFKKGEVTEVTGEWSQNKWRNPRLKRIKSDMLELSEEITSGERMEALLTKLQNKRDSA